MRKDYEKLRSEQSFTQYSDAYEDSLVGLPLSFRLADGATVSFKKNRNEYRIDAGKNWTIQNVKTHTWRSCIDGDFHKGHLPLEFKRHHLIEMRINLFKSHTRQHVRMAGNRPTLMVLPIKMGA